MEEIEAFLSAPNTVVGWAVYNISKTNNRIELNGRWGNNHSQSEILRETATQTNNSETDEILGNYTSIYDNRQGQRQIQCNLRIERPNSNGAYRLFWTNESNQPLFRGIGSRSGNLLTIIYRD